MSALDCDINVRFEGFELIVGHAFETHGITVLFGASGSGKSTLLRAIAGFVPGLSGKIALGDEVLFDSARAVNVPPHKRGIGYVFQDVRLFPHLTVLDNLAYADKRSRHLAGSIAFEGVVDAFDLEPLLQRKPGALSGGEAQRVAMARAILARPRLLLMDEPVSALDMKRKVSILQMVERLPAMFGIPVIYVTHAIDEVARLADRMVVLDAGKKIADGPVETVLERLDVQSATGRFEAGVLLQATVESHDETFKLTQLTAHGHRITMPAANLAPGTVIRLRIRARDVALATQEPQGLSIRNVFSGTLVELTEETDTAFAEALIDIGGARLRARVTRASIAELGLAKGSKAYALVKSVAFDRRGI